MDGSDDKNKGWKDKLFHEFITYWINVIYMGIFFSVFTNYRRLILAHYRISYTDYGVSLIKALILAKVVMIADAMRLGRGMEDKPLYIPTLYKTFVFTVFVAIFSVIESMVRSLIAEKGPFADLVGLFTYEWLAGALVVFFAFIPFFAFRELGRALGEGKIKMLFFQRRDTEGSGPAGSPLRPGGRGGTIT